MAFLNTKNKTNDIVSSKKENNLYKTKEILSKRVQNDRNLSTAQKKDVKTKINNAQTLNDINHIQNEIVEKSTDKLNAIQEKIDQKITQPTTFRDNSKYFAKSTVGVLGAVALLGLGTALVGLQPQPYQDLSRIVSPDPLTARYFGQFAPVPVQPYQKNAGQQLLENHFNNLSSIINDVGGLALTNAIQSFSEQSREDARKNHLNLLESNLVQYKKYLAGYDALKNNPAYKNLAIENSAHKFINNSNNLQKIISSFEDENWTIYNYHDFSDKIHDEIKNGTSPIALLYKAFIQSDDIKDKEFNHDDIKNIFTEQLFKKIIQLKFNNSLWNKQNIDNKDDANKVLNHLLSSNNQFKDIYLNTIFNDNSQYSQENIHKLLDAAKEKLNVPNNDFAEKIKTDLNDVNNVTNLFIATYNQIDESINGNIDDEHKQNILDATKDILTAIALKHKENLKSNGEYEVTKEAYNNYGLFKQ